MRETRFRAWDGDTVLGYKQHGYIKCKVGWHPYADKRGYVMEHRLIVEREMGQYLPKNAVIHHKNGVRDDNRIENLEYMVEQERHAKHHAKDLRQYVATDPIFAEIKFRLFNKNTGLTEIHTLAKLIATTYRHSQFEFRGRFTSLRDKNGVEIYEGDIIKILLGGGDVRAEVYYDEKYLAFELRNGKRTGGMLGNWKSDDLKIIGNTWENPDLLQGG